MNTEQQQFLTLLQKTLLLSLELCGPILFISLAVGLVISVFQSVTQIQESTLTFVPKIIAGITAIIILSPWMLQVYITSITEMFNNIQTYIH